MRSTAVVACVLVLLALGGCGMGDRPPKAVRATPTTDAGGVDPADLAAGMLLNASDVGASVGATTRHDAHLDDVSACAVSSGAEVERLAVVSRSWIQSAGGTVSQVLATFPRGQGRAVMKTLSADKAGRACVEPSPGFHRELGQPVGGVGPRDQSTWCYLVVADKSRGEVCTAYVRKADTITGVQVVGTDPRLVKLSTAAYAMLAMSRIT